jgi:hypothetical protein
MNSNEGTQEQNSVHSKNLLFPFVIYNRFMLRHPEEGYTSERTAVATGTWL